MSSLLKATIIVAATLFVLGFAAPARADCAFIAEHSQTTYHSDGSWTTVTVVTWRCSGEYYRVETANTYSNSGTPTGWNQSTYGPNGSQLSWQWSSTGATNPYNRPVATLNETDNECYGCSAYGPE
jgi:hypothetical protein